VIPFASQRSGGGDLATHLLNEQDNEYVEIADLRGAIADDLHGAFAEWKAEASAMTKCQNELYSLSVNPDPAQAPMPRELYDEYIVRVEEALGLFGQPRAVVFHIKEDRNGVGREHCHVVWSRIDVQEMKAIHMSFDHDKLMTVTRQFARDHGIELAPGYHKLEERRRETHRQLSLYEKFQEDSVGLRRQERSDLVTKLWNGRDTPSSFVEALEYHGYILASGKRPYVLVDIYGDTNSLPKLIDDKSVNTKAIREFLGGDYVTDTLPTVDDAKLIAQQHRDTLKDYQKSQDHADLLDELKERHAKKHEEHEREAERLIQRHDNEKASLLSAQQSERSAQRSVYLNEAREIRAAREAVQSTGLAAFLGKVSGITAARTVFHKYQDRGRLAAYQENKFLTESNHEIAREELRQGQEMQGFDMERRRVSLVEAEKREKRSLELSFEKQRNTQLRRGYAHMPSLHLQLSPPGRHAVPHKAMNRFISPTAAALRRDSTSAPPASQSSETASEPLSESSALRDEFSKAHDFGSDRNKGDSDRQSRDFPKHNDGREGPER